MKIAIIFLVLAISCTFDTCYSFGTLSNMMKPFQQQTVDSGENTSDLAENAAAVFDEAETNPTNDAGDEPAPEVPTTTTPEPVPAPLYEVEVTQ